MSVFKGEAMRMDLSGLRGSMCVTFAAACTVVLMQTVALTNRALASPPPSLPEPTQVETGIPVYPGAKYDGVTSAGYSENEHFYWFYLSADPIEKVVAFYQKQLVSVPQVKMGEAYLFTLEKGGHVAFPNHGVMIEPNKAFPRPTKTVISVIKLKPGSVE